MIIIELKDNPSIASIVKLVSKKRKAILAPKCSEVSMYGTYWDEGSRNTYFLVNTRTKQVTQLPHHAPPQFGGPREAPKQLLETGFAIVEAGVFCGKPATPTVYLPLIEA